ncbi:bifunctional methylenetetrahydrofolate dehydrogenase/methenyltetrahydrofolate cyclohydrolase FolD [Caldisalinibacter kiritimatiensis]|uniref:Bifunctional protein FolD n=1 Tax=Caldisalinibacter kiritimatiensis TaxID=1304284 RepID=R1AWZ8_9FIRM|nr:bifunctional methylenetetrahydrofolate dehydrogenase/methenyltetrahydrofolate cyclohydrolase FolD [Caldisalinibacter kiritimatiensis]EOD01728.1 Methylenetetrahydrofolate dehydrogenase / cyclohydrolase [Caldisalinibacter kiritimatiensis]
MSGKIIDGKEIANSIHESLKNEIEELKSKTDKVPGLAVILVGDDKASHKYVSMKEKACKKVGINSVVYRLDANTTEEEVLELIDKLNKDEDINGILVQLPLPNGIGEKKINANILPSKDVDGFHAVNTGKLFLGEEGFLPCTPKGIIKLIKSTDIEIEGKNAVVIGRSNIVGKPTALLLLRENATVTICHSRTRNLEEHIRNADIIVSAAGVADLVTETMVKDKAIVIDAGINFKDGKLVGDVDYINVKKKASWITPVPGGVGPMTIAMLLENTVEAFKKKWS